VLDDGSAVVRLSSDLHQQDVFAPSNWASLSAADLDLGSVSPTLVSGGLVFEIGKAGDGYVLDAGHLGGVGGQLAGSHVCNGAYGATAVQGEVVFVPCRDGLVAIRVSRTGITVLWRGPPTVAGSPIVAGGMVWMMSVAGDLYELDEATGAQRYRAHVGKPQTHFPSAAAALGQLYVVDGLHVVSFRGV
jgi:polyvinyl alcohol dehydrogenase (cytochrome)